MLAASNNSSISPELDGCASYEGIIKFGHNYDEIHKYLCLVLCPMGLTANVVNIVVLNQASMRSLTNYLLTSLAVSEGLVMSLYLLFDVYFLLGRRMYSMCSLWCAHYLLWNVTLSHMLHAFSSWTLVSLALFRVIYIRYPGNLVATFCTLKWCVRAILLNSASAVLLTVPFVMAHEVIEDDRSSGGFYTIGYVSSGVRLTVLFWTSSILVKALPLLLICVLSVVLVLELRKSVARQKRLHQPHSQQALNTARLTVTSLIEGNQPITVHIRSTESVRRTVKTTQMLLMISGFFIFAYLPHSILLLLNHFLGKAFSVCVYDSLSFMVDLLTLVNNSATFVLYCVMSEQFRAVFQETFHLHAMCRHSSQGDTGVSRCPTNHRQSENYDAAQPRESLFCRESTVNVEHLGRSSINVCK